jgi:hypothetical protein
VSSTAASFAAVGLCALALGCSSGHKPAPSIVVSAGGRIGSLQAGRSDATAIVAFVGRPDADRRGSDYGSSPYRGLGYGCSTTAGDDTFPLVTGGLYCRTVFFVNARTGRLGDFFTTSPRYEESHGVRIGMSTAAAERLLHRRVYVGCEADIHLGSLGVAFAGGRPRRGPASHALHLVGGRVYAFAVHGGRDDVGVFDCL